MKNEIYRAFVRAMGKVTTAAKKRNPQCPIRIALCVMCGQMKPSLPVGDVGFVCHDCASKRN